jgi:hypothetical protein
MDDDELERLNRELINQEQGAIERLTVNLIPKSQAALRRATEATGDSLTDTVNRTLVFYDYAVAQGKPKRDE